MILRAILSLFFIIKLRFKQTNNIRLYIYIYCKEISIRDNFQVRFCILGEIRITQF